MSIELKVTPRKGAMLVGHDNLLEVLVQAVGPKPPENTTVRKTVNLALVIDRSGSMSGQPLDEAKRCAAMIVDQLTPNDYVSIVAYDDEVEIVWPSMRVENAAAVKNAILGISTRGSTALFDGWAAGAEQVALNVANAAIPRVMLLSDGCANKGLTDPDAIASRCAQMAAKGVGTSTYGLGSNFNEHLMFAMARSGGGNAYYGQTAADLMGPFQEEFDLLQALYARSVTLRLSSGPGVQLTVANDLLQKDGGWCLPDIAYGSEAWTVVRLRVPKEVVSAGENGAVDLVTASLVYETEGGAGATGPVQMSLPSLPLAAHVALAEDDLVKRRAQEVRFAEFQREAAAAARARDWYRVELVLGKARKESEGNEWLSASMQSLEQYARMRDSERFSKEASFKSARMMSRLAESAEVPEYSAAREVLKPSYLRRRDEEGKADQPKD